MLRGVNWREWFVLKKKQESQRIKQQVGQYSAKKSDVSHHSKKLRNSFKKLTAKFNHLVNNVNTLENCD